MALSSSLYTGTSGLINMGNVMQVVSNNLANSGTVGFKKGNSSFADTLSQTVATQSGVAQIGRGMSIGEVAQNFEQGAFESTGNVTDLSIGGDGFFIVSDPGENVEYYTRAGNFHFDEAGKLVNPNGLVVQGWELDSDTGDDVGAITDIIMDSFTSPPKESTSLTAITNLDADAISQSDVMANYWDASETDAYIAGERYEYQTVVKVYDSLGSAHDVSIYYDKKTGTEWEYMITCEPEEDKRELLQETNSEGLLARGTITFSQSSGDIVDITMEELTGRVGNLVASGVNDAEDMHFTVENREVITADGYGFDLTYNGTSWEFNHPYFEEEGSNIINEVVESALSSTRSITLSTDPDSIYDDLGNYAFSFAGGSWAQVPIAPATTPTPAVSAGPVAGNDLQFTLASGTVVTYDFGGAAPAITDRVSFTVDAETAVSNYKDASILFSDSQNVYIKLNNTDQDADLKLVLDKPADTGDTISFDINAEVDLHVQGINGSNFDGETENGNTTITVNDPSVMTIDEKGLNVVWYPDGASSQWRWGNPQVAADQGTLIPDIQYDSTGAAPALTSIDSVPSIITPSIYNGGDASAMTKYVKDIQLKYDLANTTWDWDMPFKATGEDITNEQFNLGTADASRTITPDTTNGVFDDKNSYEFVFTAGPPSSWAESGGLVPPANLVGDENGLKITLASGTVIEYEFSDAIGDQGSIEFEIVPSPPEEYPKANIVTDAANTNLIKIDFDGNPNKITNNYDLQIDLGTVPANGAPVIFSLDPDTPPENYPEAKLTGDQTKAVIDLDGSGNEDDSDDIIFSFTDDLDVTGTKDVSLIEFDIGGSTAWRSVDKDEAKDTGYFSFTADFLGGDNGNTENDIKLDMGAKYDGANFQNDSMSTTQYAKPSSTVFQTSDGYAAGDFEGVDISVDGTITGIYSNGELIPLFRVGLAKFLNNNGLSNEGGNLFSETRDSGDAITNRPGENGLGTIAPSSLELSNVDISEEFVDMITTQRGFQANSKTVTTVDAMMETVIGMKR